MKTTNYEISKQLAEAGFKAKSIFGWHVDGKECAPAYPLSPTATGYFWSYDLETILDTLPRGLRRGLRVEGKYWELGLHFREFGKSISYNNGSIAVYLEENESLADVAAKMWLKLKQEELV